MKGTVFKFMKGTNIFWVPAVRMQFSMSISIFLHYLGLLNKDYWQTWLKNDLMANVVRKLEIEYCSGEI